MFTPDIPVDFNSPDIITLFTRFNINPSSTQKIGRNTYLLHSLGQPIVLKSSLSSYQLDSIIFALDCISSAFPSLTIPNVIDSTCSSSSNCLLLLSYVSGQSLTAGDYGAVFRSLTSGSSSLLQSFRSLDHSISIDSREHFFDSMSSQITNMITDKSLYSPLLSYFNAGPPDKSPSLIHGDFIFQNMVYVDSLDDPLALIDWEFSGVYYRSFDYSWFLVMSCVYELCDVNDLPSFSLNCPNERYFLLYSFLRLLLRLSQVRHRSDVHSLQELRFTRMLVNFLELYKLPPLAIP